MKRLILLCLAVLMIPVAAAALSNPLGRIQSFAFTASTTAAKVSPSAWVAGMKSCMIANVSATPVYVGGSDVTTSNGFPICTDTAVCSRADINPDVLGGELWAVVSSGTVATRAICGG